MKIKNKILIIDDDNFLSRTISYKLESENYDVYVANNGAQGIQKAFEFSPNLILCDINMDPVDGYQVYNVLKESSLIDQVPFIFITGNSDIQDIRIGMDMGVDDYFVKPFNVEDLILTIEKRLNKLNKLKEIGRKEFNALFRVAPDGIFLFDGNVVFDANPALIKMLGFKKDNLTSYTIEDIIDPVSYHKIEEKISRCSKGLLNFFSEQVLLKTADRNRLHVDLVVSVYEKCQGHSLMVGLVTHSQIHEEENEGFATNILKVLKRGNMTFHDTFDKDFAGEVNYQDLSLERHEQGLFSTREAEVLCLSMEGLPMKLIADKLSISERTVEKHRANLMGKTNSKNIIEVIIYALRHNLIEI
ncbi:MAG: response regulator [Prolixibacteraceae bacterium]|jgi:PAS domain S-box-containing protein